MNSHDKGVVYGLASEEARANMHKRQIQIADIGDAMERGFVTEPKLAPEHLPLLSDVALAEIHEQSEDWRNKAHERALEELLREKQAESNELNDRYVKIREIIGALDVPPTFRRDDSDRYYRWTEQTAIDLKTKADAADMDRKAAVDAEARVDLLGRYVRACDDKRRPYDWRVFTMPTKVLREMVSLYESDATERLGRYTTNRSDANDFEKRLEQEAAQSARLRGQRIDETRLLVIKLSNYGQIPVERANQILDVLLDRPQAGEQQDAAGWIEWQPFDKDRRPTLLNDEDMVEIVTVAGSRNTLEAGVVAWEQVRRFRPVK